MVRPAAVAVTVQRRIAAPRERVFEAWINPEILAGWMSPEGHAVAEVDPRPGGVLKVVMVGGQTRIEHEGQFREVVPPQRLVFSWVSPYTGPAPSVVTVELEAAGAATLLTLTHERLPVDQVEPHAGGWSQMLDRLAQLLAEP